MIRPKQGLHSFTRIYQAKSTPPPARANLFGSFAAELAAANVVHETDAQMLQNAQDEYSISTLEEITALARLDISEGTNLLQDMGLAPDIRDRLLNTFAALAGGQDALREMERYEKIKYELGCVLDLANPPVDHGFLGPVNAGGVIFGAPPGAALPPVAPPAGAPVPPPALAVNLIDVNMPPIRDQANRGTCVAFTTVACLEYHLARFGAQPVLDLSEQFEFWNMVTSAAQRNLVSGFPLLKTSGVCRESTWPYYGNPIPPNDDQGPVPSQAVTEAPAFCCRDVRQVPARSVPDIQAELSGGRLVGIGIPVYKSWFNSGTVRQYGNITVPLPGEVPMQIGHAIALVGFADDPDFAGGGYFIVRNSWNQYWGTRCVFGPGYGTIPYKYISNFNWDAWCIIA